MINFGLKSCGCRPIGLDIGHDSIKMVQLAVNHGHVRVIAADKVRVDPEINGDEQVRRDFVVSAIKQMLAGSSFRGRDVISCLGSEAVKMTSLRLAEGEDEKVGQVLKQEAVQRFGMDGESDSINYILAGDVQQGDEVKSELIVFAADAATIRSHIELVEAAGLSPVGIDAAPCALFRSFERMLRRQEDREKTTVFIDVGSQFTTVVFGCGGRISLVKQIPVAGDKFAGQVAAKLGVGLSESQTLRDMLQAERAAKNKPVKSAGEACSPCGEAEGADVSLDTATRQSMVDAISSVAEGLVKEISLCFRYYTVTFRGKRVDKAIVAGGEAYETILLNILRRHLAVEIEQGQPFRGFDLADVRFDNGRRASLSEWAVAVGLSLKGCHTAF